MGRSFRAVIAALVVLGAASFVVLPNVQRTESTPDTTDRTKAPPRRHVAERPEHGQRPRQLPAKPAAAPRKKRAAKASPRRPQHHADRTHGLGAYRGLGTWVDVHDTRVYRHPHAATNQMRRRGVRTLYLETAHYNTDGKIFRRDVVETLIHSAHRRGIRVIAWYLPSFTDVAKDYRRSRAAIRFRTRAGQRFDGFALDIESNIIRTVAVRNRRLDRLSRMIRGVAGRDYALGAIVPEAGARYWRGFPYAKVSRQYDVFLPMAYHTFRVKGGDRVERYARRNVRYIRKASRDRKVPVHMIGGLAADAKASEVRGFVKGSKRKAAVGVSLYDFDSMRDRNWRVLAKKASKRKK